MKKLTTYAVLLFSFLLSTIAYGQYSTISPASELATFAESFVHGVPDSIYNRLKVDLKVQIKRYDEDPAGTIFDGLQTRSSSNTYKTMLRAGESAPININDFRRVPDAPTKSKRIDLIITIPKINLDELDGVTEEGVKWNLGTGHNPSYTFVKSGQGQGEIQIIAVYMDGVPPSGYPFNKIENNNQAMMEKLRRIHVQAHFCHPGDIDPRCY